MTYGMGYDAVHKCLSSGGRGAEASIEKLQFMHQQGAVAEGLA